MHVTQPCFTTNPTDIIYERERDKSKYGTSEQERMGNRTDIEHVE